MSDATSQGRRAVYDGGTRIGTAADWASVEALLRQRGRSMKAAHDAVLTRGVDTGRAFHIITADSLERMLATCAWRACCPGMKTHNGSAA